MIHYTCIIHDKAIARNILSIESCSASINNGCTKHPVTMVMQCYSLDLLLSDLMPVHFKSLLIVVTDHIDDDNIFAIKCLIFTLCLMIYIIFQRPLLQSCRQIERRD